MKSLIFLSLLLMEFNDPEKDRMPVHLLKWSEFKEPVPTNAPYSAATGYQWEMNIDNNSDGTTSASVTCYFLPYFSYTRTKDIPTLVHEQGHLTIANAFCKQLNQALKAISNCKNCEETINAMYQSAWNKMSAMQQEYDDQTSHSRIRDQQALWNEKIKNIQ